jgi:hypothetical protein
VRLEFGGDGFDKKRKEKGRGEKKRKKRKKREQLIPIKRGVVATGEFSGRHGGVTIHQSAGDSP